MKNNINYLEKKIRAIKDYPKLGITYQDITPLLRDPQAFSLAIDLCCEKVDRDIDLIAAIDARGFIFGSALANKLKLGMMMIRKQNKLPGKKISFEYDLEYGKDTLEINLNIKNKKFLLIDDLLATGGTADAAVKLIEKGGGNVSCFGSLIELSFPYLFFHLSLI